MRSLYQRLKELDPVTFERLCYHLLKEQYPTTDIRHVQVASEQVESFVAPASLDVADVRGGVLLFEQVVAESLECYGVEFFEALIQGAHNSSSQFVRLGRHPTIPRFFPVHAPAGFAGTVAVGLMGMPFGLEGLRRKRGRAA